MRGRCAVPRTLFQCVCTQRRNRIGRLSPFSEYAPSASRFKPDCSPQSKVTHSPDWRAQHRSNGKVRPPFGNAYWSPEEANLCRWQRPDVNRFKRSISGAGGVGLLEDSVAKLPNAGRLIFRGKRKQATIADKCSLKPATGIACEFGARRRSPPHNYSIVALTARRIWVPCRKKTFATLSGAKQT
jgi:hypothetical protein